MQTMTVYRIDPKTMLFMYSEPVHPDPDGAFVVPGNCVQLAPPPHDIDNQDRPRWDSTVPLISAAANRLGNFMTGFWIPIERRSDIIPD